MKTVKKEWTKADIDKLVADVTAVLPGSWTLGTTAYHHAADIVSSDGKRIIIDHVAHKHAFRITGDYPRRGWSCYDYKNYGEIVQEINVSDSKSAGQIAHDIERRFLPAYIELWDRCKQRQIDENNYNGQRVALAATLAKLSPKIKIVGHDVKNVIETYSSDGAYFKATCEPTRVDMKITNLTEGQAEEIIRLITGEPKGA